MKITAWVIKKGGNFAAQLQDDWTSSVLDAYLFETKEIAEEEAKNANGVVKKVILKVE